MTQSADTSVANRAGTLPREHPRVSVCIPAYNYAHYLGDAIDSVLEQAYDDWELIVCDNASKDNTAELVASYQDPRIVYHRYKITVPASFSFNRCFEAARGEYVLTLCADDMLSPETLEKLVKALDTHPSAALAVTHQRQTINRDREYVGEVRRHPNGPGLVPGSEVLTSQSRMILGVGIPSQVLARTDVVIEHAGFDPLASLLGDNDLYLRICENWDVVYVEDARFLYRAHPETQTLKTLDNNKFLLSDFFVFGRLFKTSAHLKGNRKAKREFINNRMYSWFEREALKIRQGRISGLKCFMLEAIKFEPVPWWMPSYAGRFTARLGTLLLRKLTRRRPGMNA